MVRKSEPDIEFARLVVDPVIDGLRGVLGREVEAYQSAERAIDLARSARDLSRAEGVERALLTYERQNAQDRFAGTWGKSFDRLRPPDQAHSPPTRSWPRDGAYLPGRSTRQTFLSGSTGDCT